MTEKKLRNPVPTVDIIIELVSRSKRPKVVFIRRRNPPFGWALPGGFVEYGESLEEAAVREAREETSLDVRLLRQLHTYSEPGRDPRLHTISTVFVARARGKPQAGDDAGEVRVSDPQEIDFPLAFDHRRILDDYIRSSRSRVPWAKRKTTRRASTRSRTRT
jgi:8-oxo-dGTP diphosphatase